MAPSQPSSPFCAPHKVSWGLPNCGSILCRVLNPSHIVHCRPALRITVCMPTHPVQTFGCLIATGRDYASCISVQQASVFKPRANAFLKLGRMQGGTSGASPRRPTSNSRRFPMVDRRSKRAGPALTFNQAWLIRCSGEVAHGGWTTPSLPGDWWFLGRKRAESGVLARRAAGRSPRREPWEKEHSHGPAPEGRHIRSPFHAAFASDTTTVSPRQG